MIRGILNRLKGNEFSRQVLTLMTGTGLGQVLGILLAPVVARLYSPEEFSTLEQIAMLLSIIGVVSAGKYELAIMLPRREEEAGALTRLSMRISFYTSLAVMILVLLFKEQIAGWYANPELEYWLFLLPIGLFCFSVFNALNYWFGRKKQYRSVATGKAAFSFVSEPTKIGLGCAGYTAGGLVISVMLGHVVSAGMLWWKYFKEMPEQIRKAPAELMRKVAKEYSDYPKFNIWASLFNRTAQWIHILLFSQFYGLLAVGYFALTRRILFGPLTLLSGSFSQVFYQRISDIEDSGELRRFYYSHLWKFILVGAAMVLGVLILPNGTMAWIFGEEWAPVQDFLELLVYWYVLNFITGSLSFINHRLKKQKGIFILDFLHFVLIILSIVLPWKAGYSEMETVTVFVIAKTIYFAINIFVSVYFVETYHRNQTRQ